MQAHEVGLSSVSYSLPESPEQLLPWASSKPQKLLHFLQKLVWGLLKWEPHHLTSALGLVPCGTQTAQHKCHLLQAAAQTPCWLPCSSL